VSERDVGRKRSPFACCRCGNRSKKGGHEINDVVRPSGQDDGSSLAEATLQTADGAIGLAQCGILGSSPHAHFPGVIYRYNRGRAALAIDLYDFCRSPGRCRRNNRETRAEVNRQRPITLRSVHVGPAFQQYVSVRQTM
jgi:hypothetical protein